MPRTFIGSLLVTILVKPFWSVMSQLELSPLTFKLLSLFLVRGCLGVLYVFSTGLFRRAFVQYYYGTRDEALAALWTAVCVSQFHLNFYATRSLPNTFALILVLFAYHFWFRRKYYSFISALVFATVVFRSELVVFFAPAALQLLFLGLPPVRAFLSGLFSGLASLAITILVDSYFWQRWLYPEGELLYFNTILNKSHEWGTLPLSWYFSAAIPKALMGSLLIIPLAVYFERKQVHKGLLLPAIAFVALYSLLPHKELRFIFYVLPIFNMYAALGLRHLWARRKGILGLVFVGALFLLLASLIASFGLAHISSQNYPGAEALNALHKRADTTNTTLKVHLDVAPCQTGFSRFLEAHPRIRYYKTEKEKHFEQYTHRITDKKAAFGVEEKEEEEILNGEHWQAVETIYGFSNIAFSKQYPFVIIKRQPALYIYQRNLERD